MAALVDPFHIPPTAKPAWMDYRWVRKSLLGDADTKNIEMAEDVGWRPVPKIRFAYGNVPAWQCWEDHEWCEYGGLVLMERPDWMSMKAVAETRRKSFELGGHIPGQGALVVHRSMGETFAEMQPVKISFWRKLWLKVFAKKIQQEEEAY